MQDKELSGCGYVLFSIPIDLLEEAGISEESIVQIPAGKGQIIIDTVDDVSDFVCDGDCESCPVDQTDCDEDCSRCPCKEHCEYCEVNEE